MTKLRELIEHAEIQIDTYKHPNLEEFKEEIDKVLVAAGLGSLQHDTIDSIYVGKEFIDISTTWSSRGCEQRSSFSLPTFIVDSDEPVKVATIWCLEGKIKKLENNLSYAKKNVIDYTEELERLTKLLEGIQ